MGQEDAGRYLDVLDESFGAAIASADRIAAADLSLSFLQDLELAAALQRGGALEAATGSDGFRPVVEVGSDYVVVRRPKPTVLRMAAACYKLDPAGASPVIVERTTVELLRSLARRATPAQIAHPGGLVEGAISRVGRDHIVVREGRGEVLIPLVGLLSLVLVEEETWRF